MISWAPMGLGRILDAVWDGYWMERMGPPGYGQDIEGVLGRILDGHLMNSSAPVCLRRILDGLGRIMNGYWMNSWAPIGLGNDFGCSLGRFSDELVGFHWFWKDVGRVLGRVSDELMGLPGFGNDIGCVLRRIWDELLGSPLVLEGSWMCSWTNIG